MASLMESFEQQYAALTADITTKTGRILNLSKEDKKSSVLQVERHLEEAHELLEQMELEVRSMPPTTRPKYLNRVKSYQAELSQLYKELQRAKIAFSDDVRSREELFGGEDGYVFDDQKQKLLDNTERVERSSKILRGGHKLVIETEEIGASILSDLHIQRESIKRTRERLKETDYDVGKSSHILTGMMRRVLQNRMVLYIVFGIVLVVIVVCIYFTVQRHLS